nr:hypothetical protein [Tanacetum cinerariifolium]
MHRVGFAHHARSDGVSISVPTIAPQGLAILLVDAATRTKTSDEASPRVGFAHHARSDGVSISVPTIAPQGLAILLVDAATRTKTSDEASPRLLRSSSLPVIHGIAKGMSEGLKHGVEHGKAKLDLEAIEAYDPEAEAKYIATLHALKNMKENEIKNLETLLEAEADIKKTAKNKSAELSAELENMRALFSDLQMSNNRLSQQVSTLQEQGAAAAGDPDSENTSFASMVGSPESIYRPEWGITNGCLLDVPEACQDLSTGPEDQEATVPEVPPPENVTTTGVAPEAGQAKRVAATSPLVVKERRKRGHDGVDTNAPPKVLRRDPADPRPIESTRGGKSLAAIELGMGSTHLVPAPQGAPVDVSDPDPLYFADPQSRPSADVT